MNAKISVLVSCNEAMLYLCYMICVTVHLKILELSQVNFASIINFKQVIASWVLLSKRVQI